ncbi:hypothetical protein J6590_105408, partial [Homalodisca vitripennis]
QYPYKQTYDGARPGPPEAGDLVKLPGITGLSTDLLRKLKETLGGTKLADGKSIKGAGRLTDKVTQEIWQCGLHMPGASIEKIQLAIDTRSHCQRNEIETKIYRNAKTEYSSLAVMSSSSGRRNLKGEKMFISHPRRRINQTAETGRALGS